MASAPRDWRLYLDDIVEACDRVSTYTAGQTYDSFVSDRRTFDAVLFNLHVLGEATKHLPDEVRALAPEIAWTRIAGMRDRIAHGYFGIDPQVVWAVVRDRIGSLRVEAGRLRERLAPPIVRTDQPQP